jgi:hypothetical protein
MNRENLIDSTLIENLGWTLVHSVWQIALVALVLFLTLRVFKNFSANARYLFAVFALASMLVLPLATFVRLGNSSAQSPLANKIYNLEKENPVSGKILRAGNQLPLTENKTETAKLSNGNYFLSFDNLQENFEGNKSGISWFERWTTAQNKKLRDEPRVGKLVYKIWNEKKSK